MRAVTGFQYDLRAATPSGPALAIVTEVAAGLRMYSVDGIDLVEPFAAASAPPWGAGIVLMPWPNRIRDGLWQHGGVVQRLALTEPELSNAIHGLLRYSPYRMLERSPSSVTLAATVFPQAGYPFLLDTTVRYALTDDGLAVTHTVRNVGRDTAPVALGAHPYLKIGGVPTEDLVLTIAANTHIDVDDRQNPVGESAVAGTRFDLRGGRRVGDIDLDDGFGGVASEPAEVLPDVAGDEPGSTVASVTAPDGRSVMVWGDRNIRNVQVFTPRNFPFEGREGPYLGLAVAIEPMTAPADAFNSGAGLRRLEPGESWTVRWGIRHTGFGL
ncbi:aldose 1-epimerase family protein [Cryobacterium cryoconiti]|uniref:Aldose epimerase n=1 Tax=Cryobacterium cryoconiti TaxID=1259239 RepID=A0A4Y8JVE2_9MICO|nr:aldose 1-epimerase family protein [Cryobacterium cryoconiti]TFD30731.1 aldose epimerase [Cryobacterium cryoconiti]